ncbi:MAG: restriction endonuclease subunit M, partial [Alphaproteobacteria bacterium]|nr:restriction endonuclease subunit M [Alphaproteobacteria bacterium]
AEYYLDNVDVGGVHAARGTSLYFLASIINGKAANFVFQHISKPFRGGFRSANKQFISPIPVPRGTDRDQDILEGNSVQLQRLYSERRDILFDIHRRLGSIRVRRRPDNWLFPNLPTFDELAEYAPKHIVGIDRREWARRRLAHELRSRHASLEDHLILGATLSAELYRGELRFFVDGVPVITGIFLPLETASFVLAQWRVLAGRLEVTGRLTGKKLADELRRVSVSADPHLMAEVVGREQEISAIDAEIARLEARVNETIYRLHNLTPDEIAVIEAATR